MMKSKKKQYYRIISLGVFPYDILVCQGMSTKDVKEHLAKKYRVKVEEEDDDAFEHHDRRQGKTFHLANNQTVLWLKHPPITPSGIATLAHEALHAINMIYATMGVPQRHENDEVFAYGVEYIVEEVLKDFR